MHVAKPPLALSRHVLLPTNSPVSRDPSCRRFSFSLFQDVHKTLSHSRDETETVNLQDRDVPFSKTLKTETRRDVQPSRPRRNSKKTSRDRDVQHQDYPRLLHGRKDSNSCKSSVAFHFTRDRSPIVRNPRLHPTETAQFNI